MLRPTTWGLVLLATAGCSALDEFEQVIVDETVIPGQATPGPFSAEFGGSFNNLDLSSAREFRNNDVSPSDVDAIYVLSIVVDADGGSPELSILSDYIERIEFYVEAEGVERTTLGVLTDVPMATSAAIEVNSGLNIKAYAVAPSMTIGADIQLTRQPFVNLTLRTTVTLLVDIDLLGA